MVRKTTKRRHHQRDYTLLALLLATGCPGGLLLLRAFSARVALTPAWLWQEVTSDAQLYLYLWASTAAVMMLLGAWLGRKEDKLIGYSVLDGLTGLGNRRYFDLRLEEEVARRERSGQALTLLLIDVDNMKRINDEGGHEAGDRALRAVAQSISQEVRASDVAARIGGDEMAILLPGEREAVGVSLAERIQARLARSTDEVTVSIGVAGLDKEHAPSGDSSGLMRDADQALYEAKRAGRARTRASHMPSLRTGPLRS